MNRQFPLRDGATVFAAPLVQDSPFDNDIEIVIELAFGEGQIFDGEPLEPELNKICDFVQGVVNIFESALPGLGK